MSRLAKKILGSVLAVLSLVMVLTLLLNSQFVERYYLRTKKNQLHQAGKEFARLAPTTREEQAALEEKWEVVMVRVRDFGDNDAVNEALRTAFLDKGLGLEKFWLWKQDYDYVKQSGPQMRLYNQGRLNYSLLVEYEKQGQELVGIAMVIPNVTEMIGIISRITALLLVAAVAVTLGILYVRVKWITRPLKKLRDLTEEVSGQNFDLVQRETSGIRTGDEIQDLAESFCAMSHNLAMARNQLLEANSQMEQLLSDVSHDLKTPIALVKAYACGMKDGLDDGTFLDTIIAQNNRLGEMTEGLLGLSRIRRQEYQNSDFDGAALLEKVLDQQNIAAEQAGLNLVADTIKPFPIFGNTNCWETIFTNLISNGISYGWGGEIRMTLKKEGEKIRFSINNVINPQTKLDLNHIWDPFYVGEESRNKDLSGTGLGLAMVQAAAGKQGLSCGCEVRDGRIYFEITS